MLWIVLAVALWRPLAIAVGFVSAVTWRASIAVALSVFVALCITFRLISWLCGR